MTHQYHDAEIAYRAYTNYSNGRSLISGDKLPGFFDLPFKVKEAWKEVADAVRAEVLERNAREQFLRQCSDTLTR